MPHCNVHGDVDCPDLIFDNVRLPSNAHTQVGAGQLDMLACCSHPLEEAEDGRLAGTKGCITCLFLILLGGGLNN